MGCNRVIVCYIKIVADFYLEIKKYPSPLAILISALHWQVQEWGEGNVVVKPFEESGIWLKEITYTIP